MGRYDFGVIVACNELLHPEYALSDDQLAKTLESVESWQGYEDGVALLDHAVRDGVPDVESQREFLKGPRAR